MDYKTQENVPFEWEIGDLILEKYEIKDIFAGGGMGLVYRAYDQDWGIDLAIKTPRENYFKTHEQIESFKTEAEHWMRVGMHPNVATCFYVTSLGRSPRIFAEFVEGGTLADWIKEGKYKISSETDKMRTIMDIAIQFARGLEHAHNKGIIHQDVKPANVLMTPDGSPKVTDFGLANARIVQHGETRHNSPDQTILVAGSGFLTVAYASPEQAAGKPLSRKTDIWSWAVCMLEVLNDGRDWSHGQAAPSVLGHLLESGLQANPLTKLLAECFAWNPEDRPIDFGAILQRLNKIYQDLFSEVYPNPIEILKSLSTDSLNNYAVSLMNLRETFVSTHTSAYSVLLDLLEIDKRHVYGRLNMILLKWNYGMITIEQMISQVESIITDPSANGLVTDEWMMDFYLGTHDYKKATRHLIKHPEYRSISAEDVTQRFMHFKKSLMDFFHNPKNNFRMKSMSALRIDPDCIEEHYFTSSIASSSPEFGIVAHLEYGNIKIFNTYTGILVSEKTYGNVKAFALSENGLHLIVFSKNERKADQKNPCFNLKLVKIINGSTSISEDLPNDFKLPETEHYNLILTVSNDAIFVNLWVRSNNGLTTVDYEFDQKSSEWQRHFDFRIKNAVLKNANLIRKSSCDKYLIATDDSQVQIWKIKGNKLLQCIFEICLFDFGLINIQDHLPHFQLKYGFEFKINTWNIFDIFKFLMKYGYEKHVPYLIVKPPCWEEILRQWQLFKKMQKELEVLELTSNKGLILSKIDQLLELGVSEKTDLLSERHSIIESEKDRSLARAWLEASVDEYWSSDIIGMYSDEKNRYILQRYRKLSIIKADACTSSGDIYQDLPTFSDYARCFGVAALQNNHFLVLLEDGMKDIPQLAVILKKLDNGEQIIISKWGIKIIFSDDQFPDRNSNRSNYSWFVCMNNQVAYRSEPDSFVIRDANTGNVIFSDTIYEDISFLKKIHIDDAIFLAVGSRTTGKVYIYNTILGNVLRVVDAGLGRGGYVEDICDNCEGAIVWWSGIGWHYVDITNDKIVNLPDPGKSEARYVRWLPRQLRYRLSRCGKSVVGDDGQSAWVIDIKSCKNVFYWKSTSSSHLACAPCFDTSGRWLVIAHSINRYDIIQLFWDIDREDYLQL